jgi:hypothetical protein
MAYGRQLEEALILAIPVACISWTITQEEVFRELNQWLKGCQARHRDCLWRRKLAYMPTCPYCLSHYVSGILVVLLGFHMLMDDWRGYLVSLFTVVLVANTYLTLYQLLRALLRRTKALADQAEAGLAEATTEPRHDAAYQQEIVCTHCRHSFWADFRQPEEEFCCPKCGAVACPRVTRLVSRRHGRAKSRNSAAIAADANPSPRNIGNRRRPSGPVGAQRSEVSQS